MWMLVLQFEFDNDTLIFEDFETAEKMYLKEVASGQLAYLTQILRTNL